MFNDRRLREFELMCASKTASAASDLQVLRGGYCLTGTSASPVWKMRHVHIRIEDPS
jgi:hypothetical protein